MNSKRNIFLVLKAGAMASIIRVISLYLFDYTLINNYVLFIIYISAVSVISIFFIPLLEKFVQAKVKNKFFCKIFRWLLVVLFASLIRPIFIYLDFYLISDVTFSTSESFKLTFSSLEEFIHVSVTYLLPLELLHYFNSTNLKSLFKEFINKIPIFTEKYPINMYESSDIGTRILENRDRGIHMASNSGSNPSGSIGSSSSGPQVKSEATEVNRERSPIRSESPVGERGMNSIPEVHVYGDKGFYRTVQPPYQYTIIEGGENVTGYRPNGSNQPFARSLANAIQDFKNTTGSFQSPSLDDRSQAFLDQFLAHTFPDRDWNIAYKSSNEVIKALKKCG